MLAEPFGRDWVDPLRVVLDRDTLSSLPGQSGDQRLVSCRLATTWPTAWDQLISSGERLTIHTNKRRAPGPPLDRKLRQATGAFTTVGDGRRRLVSASPSVAPKIWYSVLLSTGTLSYYLAVLSDIE